MDDIAEQFAQRDRFRRRRRMMMTPAQRMAEMLRLQEQAWATLCASPKGYENFMRNNFRKRAIDIKDPDDAN